MSPSTSPAAGTAVQGSFSGSRVVETKESSVADLAEEHKRKVNEAVSNRTVDHALRARQILRFLKDKHSGLKEHRQKAKNTLEGLDPGFDRTKKLAESTEATAGEEKWMHGWEKSPGTLAGYIKTHAKKWIERKTDEVEGRSTSEEKALAASEEPTEPEAEAEAETETDGMPPEEGGKTTALDNNRLRKSDDNVMFSNNVPLSNNVPRSNNNQPRDSVLLSNNVQPPNNKPLPNKDPLSSFRIRDGMESRFEPPSDTNTGGGMIQDIPGTYPGQEVVEERRETPIDVVAQPASSTSTIHPVPTATAQPEPDPRAYCDYASFAFNRAMMKKDWAGAERALTSVPPATGIDRDWYTWYRASRGKNGNGKRSA